MKTRKRVSPLWIAAILIILAYGCVKKENTPLTKSASIAINLATSKSTLAIGSGTKGSLSGTSAFTFTSSDINIANLVIEENSGNDVQQDGNFNDGTTDNGGESATKENAANEASDITLPGPYALHITGNVLNIDNVNVYPGTFKKIDFTFNVSNEAVFGGSSIIVNGTYQMQDGAVIPVILKSDFSQQVQLPLVNGGMTVTSNSSLAVSIVMDIPSWMSALDLSTATVTDGKIIIDTTNNASLLTLFEANLQSNIEVKE